MNQLVRPLIFGLVFMAAAGAACAPKTPDPSRVALIGDSEAELRRGMHTAVAAGKTPLYAGVSFGKRTFIFSPYTQLLHANSMLIVRAFATIWRFPAERATVRFDAKVVPLDALPLVVPPASWQLRKGSSAVSMPAADHASITDGWNGLKDPWQVGPPPPPWTKGAALDAENTAALKP